MKTVIYRVLKPILGCFVGQLVTSHVDEKGNPKCPLIKKFFKLKDKEVLEEVKCSESHDNKSKGKKDKKQENANRGE